MYSDRILWVQSSAFFKSCFFTDSLLVVCPPMGRGLRGGGTSCGDVEQGLPQCRSFYHGGQPLYTFGNNGPSLLGMISTGALGDSSKGHQVPLHARRQLSWGTRHFPWTFSAHLGCLWCFVVPCPLYRAGLFIRSNCFVSMFQRRRPCVVTYIKEAICNSVFNSMGRATGHVRTILVRVFFYYG